MSHIDVQSTRASAPPRESSAGARRPLSAVAAELGPLWASAIALGALGAAICFDAMPGVNWALWTAFAASGLAVFIRRTQGRLHYTVVIPIALAIVIAAGAAVTADPIFAGWILIATVVLLAVAMQLGAGTPAQSLGVVALALAPVTGAVRTAFEALARVGEAARLARGGRSVAVIRGAVIAAPIVAIFALLLADVDPVLHTLRTDLARMLDQLAWLPRFVFFFALGALVLGAYGTVLHPAPARAETRYRPELRLGATERLIVVVSVASLFALFLLLQLSYFFGNLGAMRGSGMTYAEYVHRGFGELTVVASLATLLLVALDHRAEPGPRDGAVRIASVALVALVQLLLDSAFHRIMLYERAYGYTTLRLYAQTYMIVVSLALICLGAEIWRGLDVRRLARVVAVLAGIALSGLTWWNHEAWIAGRNLDRYRTQNTIDVLYLARGLSPNAVPTLVRALPSLDRKTAADLRGCLALEYANGHALATRHWYEWSWRRSAAREVLASAGIPAASDVSCVQGD